MLRRTVIHMMRNPVMMILGTLVTPIILLLMMYNLFGGVIESNGATGNRIAVSEISTRGFVRTTVGPPLPPTPKVIQQRDPTDPTWWKD